MSCKYKYNGVEYTLKEIRKNINNILSENNLYANELVGNTFGETSDIRYQIIGEVGASRIEEYNNLLKQAKELEKQGKDYSQTGWYKSPDGWKYLSEEIVRDFKIENYKENEKLTLKEVIGNENKLFEVYPEAEKISVIFYSPTIENIQEIKDIEEDSFGKYDRKNEIIYINAYDEGVKIPIQGLKFTLGHEIQHVVSRLENFAPGGNLTTVFDEGLKILNIKGNNRKYSDILTDIRKATIPENLTENQKKVLKNLEEINLALIYRKSNYLINQYQHILGEIDANIVGQLVEDGTAVGTYEDLISAYINTKNIDPDSIYIFDQGNVEFSLLKLAQQQKAIEPNASFETEDGKNFNNYQEALKNSTSEQIIKVKIADVVVAEVSASTNINNTKGAVNDLVKQDILKGDRILNPDGSISYVTSGVTRTKKLVNATIAESQVKGSIDDAGNLIIREAQESLIKDMSIEQINKKYDKETAATLIAAKLYAENTPAFGDNKIIDEAQEIVPENQLQQNIINLLSKLGIKTMSFDNYLKNYEVRNGVPASAAALADIANRVIAFSSGRITQDQLTEETAHFIIEALDITQIQPLLDNVNKTREWSQHAEHYMNLYNDEMLVRKEILGKVLSNSIQKAFREEQNTMVGNSIVNKLKQMFLDFFDSIFNSLKPQYLRDLDTFTNQIYRNLMANELIDELNQEQFEGNKITLYSSSATMRTEADMLQAKLTEAKKYLESQDRKLDSISSLEIKEIENLENLEAALEIAKVAKRQAEYVRKSNKNKIMSSEEQIVYSTTINHILPILSYVRSALETSQDYKNRPKDLRLTLETLTDTIDNISKLRGEVSISQNAAFEAVVDKVAVDEQQKEAILKNFELITKDTNWFYQMAGGVIHANNPALNMFSAIVADMSAKAKIGFNDRMRAFLNKADALGYSDEQLAKELKKFKRGYYLFNAFDFAKAEEDLNTKKAEILNEIFKEQLTKTDLKEEERNLFQRVVTKEDIAKEETVLLKGMTTDLISSYYYRANLYQKEEQNLQAFSAEENNKRKKFIADNNISEQALIIDNNFAKKRSKITNRARKEGGFSEATKALMEELIRDRAFAKNPFKTDGTFKDGLSFDENGELQLDRLTASEDAIIVYELNKLDKFKAESFQAGEQVQYKGFIDKLLSIEDMDQRLEFLKLNANISFSNEFWDKFDKDSSTADLIEDKEAAKKLRELTAQRSNILKANKVFNNPTEVNYASMDANTLAEVKELTEKIDALKKENKVKRDSTQELPFESIVSDAYLNELYNYYGNPDNITEDQEFEFIRKHVTDASRFQLDNARKSFEDFKNGRIKNLPEYLQGKTLRQYSRTKLLPYFTKIQPVGFSLDAALAEYTMNPNSIPQYLSITPNYIFITDEENTRVNKDYLQRFENGEPLLNEKYFNKEYFDYFGIRSLTDAPTRNVKEFELLKAIVEFQEDTIESAGMTGKHNKYLLPSKRPQGYENLAKVPQNAKESAKNFAFFREEDSIYGQTAGGEVAKNQIAMGEMIIPRYGFNKLESAEQVSEDLLQSYMWMASQSELRKQRVEALLDIEAIKSAVLNKQYGDKQGESTNTYKMLDNFIRSNIYGQAETFNMETNFFGLKSDKVNIAPTIKQFQGWIRLVNLGYNLLTPFISFLQGSVNLFTERIVGARIDKDAFKLASKKSPGLLFKSATDWSKLAGNTELSMLEEFMGQGDAASRFENSQYGRIARGLAVGKSAFFTHSLADAPLSAQIILTVLHDFRVIDGEILNFAQYKKKNAGKSLKQMREDWRKAENDVIYNYIKLDKAPNEKYGKFTITEIPGLDKEYVEKRLKNIRNSITLAKQEIDSAIPSTDRTYLQRHALLSFFSLHKGYLMTSMTRRLKSRHENVYSGVTEEGSWTGFGSFLSGIVSEYKNSKNFRQALKTEWAKAKADPTRMESLKRVLMDFGATTTLALIAFLLKNAADDDDEKDNYALQLGAYLGYRLATEVTSQSTGLPLQAYKFAQSPTVGISQVDSILTMSDLASGDIVTRGNFKGLTERERWLFKGLPALKEYWKITNINGTKQSYEYYNKELEYYTIPGYMLKKDKNEE